MMSDTTQEPQYGALLDQEEAGGLESLGLMTSYAYNDDPKRLTFTLARYKFVSKMLAGRDHVLEIGCADAFATRIVRQEVKRLTATDFDPLFIADVQRRMNPRWSFDAFVHDMLVGPVPGSYDAIYALDVLEHIDRAQEDQFVVNMLAGLAPHGVVILGMPSLESQTYASKLSKEGHVNCKTGPDFRSLMEKSFHSVFMFSMNDEVVHTGYHKMAHYLFALCSDRKNAL